MAPTWPIVARRTLQQAPASVMRRIGVSAVVQPFPGLFTGLCATRACSSAANSGSDTRSGRKRSGPNYVPPWRRRAKLPHRTRGDRRIDPLKRPFFQRRSSTTPKTAPKPPRPKKTPFKTMKERRVLVKPPPVVPLEQLVGSRIAHAAMPALIDPADPVAAAMSAPRRTCVMHDILLPRSLLLRLVLALDGPTGDTARPVRTGMLAACAPDR